MGIVLDSSILVSLERNGTILDELNIVDDRDEVFISVITASEILHGVFRANSKKIKQKRSSFVESLIEQIPIIPIDLRIARAHALLWSELTKSGSMIGMNDSWIAATCIAHNMKLATLDKSDFSRVSGIEIV